MFNNEDAFQIFKEACKLISTQKDILQDQERVIMNALSTILKYNVDDIQKHRNFFLSIDSKYHDNLFCYLCKFCIDNLECSDFNSFSNKDFPVPNNLEVDTTEVQNIMKSMPKNSNISFSSESKFFECDQRKVDNVLYTIIEMIQNQHSLSIFDEVTVNTDLILLYIFKNLIPQSKYYKSWHFFYLSSTFLQLLNRNNFFQVARDISEQLFLVSIDDDVPLYGFYVQMQCYSYQNNIVDALIYASFIFSNINRNFNLPILVR